MFFSPWALLAQQPTPRKAPIPKAPAKAATPVAPAAEQPQFKGIWEPVNYSEDIQLNDVFFVNTETGWVAAAHGTLLKTTDGGATWNVQLGGDPQSQERKISDLRFVSETTGWATQITGTHTNLLQTTDGENWEQVGTIPEHYEDYFFTTETEGVFAHGDKVYRTTDGGRNWAPVYTCQVRAEVQGLTRNLKCEILRMQFPTPSVGFALAYISLEITAILKTEDGGGTWNLTGLMANEYARDGGIFFTDENNGVVLTRSGKSWVTADGGQTWKGMIATNLGENIRFADPEVGWSFANLCVGMGCQNARLSYTTDGGRRWTSRSFAFPAGVAAFSLPQRDRAFAVGAHGMIYRYRVVPVEEQVAKAIEAPAMPGFDSPLDEQVEQLSEEAETLESSLTEAAQAEGVEPDAAPAETPEEEPEAGGEEEAEEAEEPTAPVTGWAKECCGSKIQKLQTVLEAVSTEIPQFTGKYRNLNLVSAGVQLIGQFFGQTQSLKDSFRALRKARNPQAALSALTELTSQVQQLRQTTKSAFQKQE